MQPHSPTRTLTILLLFSSIITTATSTTCNTFTPIDSKVGLSPVISYVVSPGTTCPGPANCIVTTSGIISVPLSINASLDTADRTALLSLITSTTKLTFGDPVTTNVTGAASFTLLAGQSGYERFTPHVSCVNGTLSGCPPDSGIENGTVVQACSPPAKIAGCETEGRRKMACISGTIDFVNTTQERAAMINCTACTEEDKESGAAVAVVGVRGSAAIGVLGVCGAVVLGVFGLL